MRVTRGLGVQLRTGNLNRFLEISIGHYPDLQGTFLDFKKFSLPVTYISKAFQGDECNKA